MERNDVGRIRRVFRTNKSIRIIQIYEFLLRRNKFVPFFIEKPVQVYYSPIGFQEVESPRFLGSRHMKVVRLSALRTGRLYSPGNIPGTHFCYRQSQPHGHV